MSTCTPCSVPGYHCPKCSARPSIYGNTFSPLLALKALAYYEEPALVRLAKGLRGDLAAAVKAVDLSRLPSITPFRPRVEKP